MWNFTDSLKTVCTIVLGNNVNISLVCFCLYFIIFSLYFSILITKLWLDIYFWLLWILLNILVYMLTGLKICLCYFQQNTDFACWSLTECWFWMQVFKFCLIYFQFRHFLWTFSSLLLDTCRQQIVGTLCKYV